MSKVLEITNKDNSLNDNTIDYTKAMSNSGIKFLNPVGRNYNNQLLWLCKCPYCGVEFIDLPARILNGHKNSCGCLKTTNCKDRKINIKYSFKDWCIDNGHFDFLELWDYELNDLSPDNVSYKTSKKYFFKCINKNEKHHSEQHQISHIVNRGVSNLQCSQCNSFAQWGIDNICEDFLEKYWDYDKNELDPWEISYASNKKIWIICQEKEYHGSYIVMCNKFSNGRCRCPYCNKNSGKVHKFDSLGYLYPEVLEIWSDKNEKSPYEYSSQTNKKVWFKCKNNCHNDYLQAINNAVNREFRCPECVNEMKCSVLQSKVSDYINSNYNYTLLHENKCTLYPINPKTGYPMPFDNEIYELKLIIEVNGEQHYEPSFFIKLGAKKHNISVEEEFEKRIFKDKYKKQYAIDNGYEYLEIPYTAEKNDYYKQLIDNKINFILNNKK